MSPARSRAVPVLLSLSLVAGGALTGAVDAGAKTPPKAAAGKTAGKVKRPSDKELEGAIKTLVNLTLSYEEQDPRRKLSSMAVMALVSDLAGVGAPMGPGAQGDMAGFDKEVARLEKKGIRVNDALGTMLAEMRTFQCRSMQTEAKANLKSLYVAEESYRAEFDTYDKDTKKLGFEPHGGAKTRYRYEILEAGPTSFKARATGIEDEVKGDVWEISEKNDLTNVEAKCPRP